MSNVTPISSGGQGGRGLANQLRKMILAGTQYSRDKYYLEAGSSFRSQLRLNLSRNVNDALAIVRGHNDNYRTKDDQLRNYIIHGLMHDVVLLAQDGHIEAVDEIRMMLDLDEKLNKAQAKKDRYEAQLKMFQMYEDNADINIQNDDVEAMSQAFHEIEDASNDPSLPPGLRRRYEDLYDDLAVKIRTAKKRNRK